MVAKEVKRIISKLRYNKIYTYDVFDSIENRNALYVAINRLIKDNVIARYSKGKFYKVKIEKSEYFESGIKIGIDDRVAWRELIVPNQDIALGNGLYNARRLTTQNAFVYQIGTISNKRGLVQRGGRKVKYFKIPVQPTLKNKEIIEFIDILSNKNMIMDLIEYEYSNYVKKIVGKFKKDEKYLKRFVDIISKYNLKTKKNLISNLQKIDRDFANFLVVSIFPKYKQRGMRK